MTTSPISDAREKRLIQGGPGFASGLPDLPGHLNAATIGAALVAVIFGCTVSALIVIDGAQEAGLSAVQTPILQIHVFGGLISVAMVLYYKQPVTSAWSEAQCAIF